jgi:hypothetical protein
LVLSARNLKDAAQELQNALARPNTKGLPGFPSVKPGFTPVAPNRPSTRVAETGNGAVTGDKAAELENEALAKRVREIQTALEEVRRKLNTPQAQPHTPDEIRAAVRAASGGDPFMGALLSELIQRGTLISNGSISSDLLNGVLTQQFIEGCRWFKEHGIDLRSTPPPSAENIAQCMINVQPSEATDNLASTLATALFLSGRSKEVACHLQTHFEKAAQWYSHFDERQSVEQTNRSDQCRTLFNGEETKAEIVRSMLGKLTSTPEYPKDRLDQVQILLKNLQMDGKLQINGVVRLNLESLLAKLVQKFPAWIKNEDAFWTKQITELAKLNPEQQVVLAGLLERGDLIPYLSQMNGEELRMVAVIAALKPSDTIRTLNAPELYPNIRQYQISPGKTLLAVWEILRGQERSETEWRPVYIDRLLNEVREILRKPIGQTKVQ